jgi:hypothetical protein
MLRGGSVEMPPVVPRQVEEMAMRSSHRRIGKSLMFWPLVIVFDSVLFLSTTAWAGELHTSVLVKAAGDSFVCSASNIRSQTLPIEIVMISGGTPPEDIVRQTLTCGPRAACSLGTSPSDDRTAARCSVFFPGSETFVRGVLRTFNANDRAEARSHWHKRDVIVLRIAAAETVRLMREVEDERRKR